MYGVRYGVIRCFVGVSAQKWQLFHPHHFPRLIDRKIEDFCPKNKQLHSAEAECSCLFGAPGMGDSLAVRVRYGLGSGNH